MGHARQVPQLIVLHHVDRHVHQDLGCGWAGKEGFRVSGSMASGCWGFRVQGIYGLGMVLGPGGVLQAIACMVLGRRVWGVKASRLHALMPVGV